MGEEGIQYDYQGNIGGAQPQKHPQKLKSVAGNDGGLDVTGAVQHVPQDVLQLGERGLASDVVRRLDFLLGNQLKGAADRVRRMVERRLQADLGVMQTVGVDLDLGTGGASAE